MQHIDDCMPRLQKDGVIFLTGHKLCSIGAEQLELEKTATGEKVFLDTEYTVLSLGVRSEQKLYTQIKARFPRVALIGDAAHTGRIADATAAGYAAAKALR